MATNPSIELIASPKVLAIPVTENQDPLVDLRAAGGICIGPSPEIPNNQDYYYLRRTVYEKLIAAQKMLPKGLHFCLYEAYRSLELQSSLFQNRLKKVQALHPNWTYSQQFTETTRLVSPVLNLDGSKNVPPHSTGGAFDLYLIDDQGVAVDMGIHPKDWMEDKDGSISQTDSKDISDTAQHNRAIMNKVLEDQGFANYPAEYWHWSYGDRYWAYVKKEPAAIYGSIAEKDVPR
ncbi:MAG TPA: M15 family metallopeptidase [Coxiellaceae bacterium]|nr:M15 family metallopeptidase [Coxiellaceae bacterium]